YIIPSDCNYVVAVSPELLELVVELVSLTLLITPPNDEYSLLVGPKLVIPEQVLQLPEQETVTQVQ
ncbi:Uncharacterized protein FKW44_009040, partial [Caligus rogercresseyi]